MNKNNGTKYERKVYNTIDVALSQRDYEHHQAIGELLDNSIANLLKELGKVKCDITVDEINKIIIIEDNGCGQDAQGLVDAWSIGKPNEKGNSRFGVGLNQSAPALARKVTLESKKKGEEKYHRFHFDKDVVKNNVKLVKDDLLEIQNIDIKKTKYSKEDHFFRVVLRGLYRRPTRRLSFFTKDKLSSYFSSYIREGILEINYIHISRDSNGEIIKEKDTIKPKKRPNLVKKVKIENKKFGLTGWWGITEKGTRGRTFNFGADTYYNGRLTTQSDLHILKIPSRHPNYYRLECELHFDTPTVFDGNITSSKNNWVKNEDYQEVRDWLSDNVKGEYLKSLDKQRSKEKESLANKKIESVSPIASSLVRDIFPDTRVDRKVRGRAKSSDDVEGTGIFEVENRKSSDNPSNTNGENKDYNGKRKPTNTHRKKRKYTYIYIDGTKYNIEVKPVDYLDSMYPRYASSLDEDENLLVITINMKNPYVEHYKDKDIDTLLINIGEWIIESVLLYAHKITDTEDFIAEREDKVTQVDWNKWLNDIDDAWDRKEFKEELNKKL